MTGVLLSLLLLGADPADGHVRSYRVDGPHSHVTVAVDRSGLLGFAGHAHEVVAPSLTGDVVLNLDDPSRSEVTLCFQTGALRVTGRGDPPKDVPKVQAAMVGPGVLDVAQFPLMTFHADSVAWQVLSAGEGNVDVTGELNLRGVTRRMTLPMRVEFDGDSLIASGTAAVRQTDFGIHPISVAGVVKVKDEVTITYRIVTRLR